VGGGGTSSGLCPAASFDIGVNSLNITLFNDFMKIMQQSLVNHGFKWLLHFLGDRL
jgi:hypothetical protein